MAARRGVDPNYKGKGLQLEFTVEDPGVFTMPWSATITYGRIRTRHGTKRLRRKRGARLSDDNYFSDKDAHLPTADKPDF